MMCQISSNVMIYLSFDHDIVSENVVSDSDGRPEFRTKEFSARYEMNVRVRVFKFYCKKKIFSGRKFLRPKFM